MTIIYETTEIGLLIRKKRIELGMTQYRLANVSGVGTRFISELENGKPTAQLGKVLDMLHVLGLDMSISDRGK